MNDKRLQLARVANGLKRVKYSQFRYIGDFTIWCDEALWAFGFSISGMPAPTKLPFSSEKAAKTAARKLVKELKQEAIRIGSQLIEATELTSDRPEFPEIPSKPFPITYDNDCCRSEIDFYGLDGHVFGAIKGFYGSQAWLSLQEGDTLGLWAIVRQGNDENVARLSTEWVEWDKRTATSPNYVEIAIPAIQEFMKGLSLELFTKDWE